MIADVVTRAYAAVPYSDHREHQMVARLRESHAFVPELSLFAEAEGTALGHIMLTRAKIGSGSTAVATLALAPLSVAPEVQGRGIGSRLVGVAHHRARALGFESIVVVGPPDYYPRFGYEQLSRYPITLPFDAPDTNCMILRLTRDALDNVSGQVQYADAWHLRHQREGRPLHRPEGAAAAA